MSDAAAYDRSTHAWIPSRGFPGQREGGRGRQGGGRQVPPPPPLGWGLLPSSLFLFRGPTTLRWAGWTPVVVKGSVETKES